MNINWFTFFAQIVNFLILLVLLRRFLYKPVLRVMAEREAQIALRFKEAEEMTEDARAQREACEAERLELAEQRTSLLHEARNEAEAHRTAMIDDARSEVDELQRSWLAAIQQEKDRFLQELRTRMGEAVYHVAQDALADLANADLEEAIGKSFLLKLRQRTAAGLGPDSRTDGDDDVIIVRSSFELSPRMQDDIRRLLIESTAPPDISTERSPAGDAAGASVAFMREPDLICGIETEFGSRRIAWSVRDYLDSYAEQIDGAIVAAAQGRTYSGEADLEDVAAGGILPA